MEWYLGTYPWAWPLNEVFHFVGLALLVGIVGMYDLRVLGVAKGLPVAQVQRLIPMGVLGYVLSVMTGIVFVSGDPFFPAVDKLNNLAFELKMLFMLLAGLNVLAFYLTGVARVANALAPGHDAPLSAKVIAGTSLFLWIGVIYFGRMIMYADVLYTQF